MQKIKNVLKGQRHHEDVHHTAADTVVPDAVVPGSVPVTGTYSKTEAEYQAAMGGAVGKRSAGEVVAERPIAAGVAEIPVVVTEQERVSTGMTQAATHGRAGEEVCGQKVFTKVQDRPVVKERVETIVEHRPVEKQYVVETRFVGEAERGVASAEVADVKERVVEVAQPGPTCPVGTGAIMEDVVAGVGGHTGHHTGAHHHTGMHHHTDATDRVV